MRKFVSESRLVYEDYNHGQFSKKLAEWAIGNMKPLKPHPIEEMKEVFKKVGINIEEKAIYTAWYLYNMAFADYPKALPTDDARAYFVKETLSDPDCKPEAVLETFIAKMCTMCVPIHWEEYL